MLKFILVIIMRLWLSCTTHPVLFGCADMKNFQQVLKTRDVEEGGKVCTERHERGKEDAERASRRHPATSETGAENSPIQGYKVSRSITVTLQVVGKF